MERDSGGGRTEVPQTRASAGAASGKREVTSRRTPYQAPLLTVALAALVLLVALGELAVLPGRNPGPVSSAAPDAAKRPIRYRVIFARDARAADIGDLLASEGLSVLSGPDPEGAYVLGAVDSAHARSSVESCGGSKRATISCGRAGLRRLDAAAAHPCPRRLSVIRSRRRTGAEGA
jgi:hypothetical protein